MRPYYEADGITIYHGDCRDVVPALCLAVDAVVTDPPYGIGFASQPTSGRRARGLRAEAWDDAPVDVRWLVGAAGATAIWGGNYFGLPRSRGWLAWCKPDAPPSMGSVEFCWTSVDRNAAYVVQSIARTNAERCGHPTQKPLGVMQHTIAFLRLSPGSTILDPYAGSGTTLVAAKNLGHVGVGIERDERYCEIAAKRLAQGVLDFGGVA